MYDDEFQQANKSVTQAETYLSGHFSETKVAPQEITTSSRPLLFWIVYLMTSSPVSVLPKTSWLTTMFLVGLLWSFCTGDDRLTTAREQWVTRPRNKRQLCRFPHVHLHDLLQTDIFQLNSNATLLKHLKDFSVFHELCGTITVKMTEKSRIVNQWCVYFEKGRDFDSWGQLVEAADEYSRCVYFEFYLKLKYTCL